jgi:phospholipid/cholesterol/gamma-HCH transport system substrate-binding protein
MKFNREFKIGISGVAAAVLLVIGINYLKGVNLFKPTNYYFVKYENVGGLPKSSGVFADGYRIGIVHDIIYDYDHPGNITVEIEVDKKMRIPKGTRAELASSLLGSITMNLKLPIRATAWYNKGDTIIGGLQSGLTDDIQKSMLPQVEKILPKLDSILASLNTILADKNIPNTLASVKVTADNLAATSADLRIFMHSDMPQITGKINKMGDHFIETSKNLESVSSTLNKIDYASTFRKIDQTMANVKNVTDQLGKKDNTLGLLLNDSTLYNNLNKTSTNASILLKDLKEHPKRYVHFSLF